MKDIENLTLHDDAFHGRAGEFIQKIAPGTEAHPAAMLIHLLAGMASILGPYTPYITVGDARHPTRIQAVTVGPTGKGRKGLAASTPLKVLSRVDPRWANRCIVPSLSTGEGLISRVRDPLTDDEPNPPDKRLFFLETEFGRLLAVKARDQNTLSHTLRDAWDGTPLSVTTKNSPLRATDAHVCGVGHVTTDELRNNLTAEDQANGFANRFFWIWTYRTQSIPRPAPTPEALVESLALDLKETMAWADVLENKLIVWSDDAARSWDDHYLQLSAGRPGFVGAMLSRAEAQTLRLALIYAVLDRSREIRGPHLQAALAWWRYCEATIAHIYGDTTGNFYADRIWEEIQRLGFLRRSDIYPLFNGRIKKTEVDAAFEILVGLRRIRVEQVEEKSWRGTREVKSREERWIRA